MKIDKFNIFYIIKTDILIEKNQEIKCIINKTHYISKPFSKQLYELIISKLENIENISLLDKFDELTR